MPLSTDDSLRTRTTSERDERVSVFISDTEIQRATIDYELHSDKTIRPPEAHASTNQTPYGHEFHNNDKMYSPPPKYMQINTNE